MQGNRDDLDPDIDSGGEKDEPFSRKSNIGEGTSKHGIKLKSLELLASMSSSKCLLKRCIEKVVESETNTEEEADASESKKKNCAEDHFSSSQPVGSVIIMSSGTSSCTDTIKGVEDDSISVKKAWIDKKLTEMAEEMIQEYNLKHRATVAVKPGGGSKNSTETTVKGTMKKLSFHEKRSKNLKKCSITKPLCIPVEVVPFLPKQLTK